MELFCAFQGSTCNASVLRSTNIAQKERATKLHETALIYVINGSL